MVPPLSMLARPFRGGDTLRLWLQLLLLSLLACAPSPLEQADQRFKEGRYDQAAALYQAADAQSSNDPQLRRRLALSLAWSERPSEAEPLLLALSQQANDPEIAAALTDVTAVLRGGPEAEALALKSLEQFPDASVVVRAGATLTAQRGELDEARRLLEHALNLDPKNVAALANLGDLQLKQQDYPGAIVRYQEAVALQPLSPLSVRLRVRMAQVIAESSPYQSLTLLEEAVSIMPEHPEANAELGKVQALLGDCDRGMAALKRAAEKLPQRGDVISTLGYCYLQQAGRDGQRSSLVAAQTWFERLIKQSPRWKGAHTNLGLVLLRLDDPEGAEAAFRQELTLYPSSVEAMSNLGRLLADHGKADEASAMLERAFSLDKRQVLLPMELGALAMSASDYAKALTWYQAAYLLCQNSPFDHPCRQEVPYQLARLLVRQREVDAAVRLFKEALQAGFRDIARFKAEPELKVLASDSEVAAFLNGTR
ncbi:MAG: tetratricopeptide repeat protein [Myxococcota bacterium]